MNVEPMKPGEPYSANLRFLLYQIPVSLAADRRLKSFPKMLFGVLRWHAGKHDYCFVRRDTLAKELGTSIDTVDRGLLALIGAKLIQAARFTWAGRAWRISTCRLPA